MSHFARGGAGRYNMALMNDSAPQRPRILTGDTPTGKLHLGHYVGSIENRLALQESHDCFFIVANVHALTTRAEEAPAVSGDVFEIVTDYLACGIDPDRSTIFLQSEVPAIAELTWYFAMLLGHGRLLRNPTLKDELTVKAAEANHSFGFLLYPVGQVADILAFRPDAVPVGEDQVPHIEMTREVARRFNVLYAGVDPQAGDAAHAEHGVFPVPEPLLGRVTRLLGIDGKQKMSKSLGNAIFLADEAKTVEKKCRKIFTGRVRAEEPGRIEGNPVFQMLEAFHEDAAELEDMGFFDLMAPGALLAVEWGGRFEHALPLERIDVTLLRESETDRRIDAAARGEAACAVFAVWSAPPPGEPPPG